MYSPIIFPAFSVNGNNLLVNKSSISSPSPTTIVSTPFIRSPIAPKVVSTALFISSPDVSQIELNPIAISLPIIWASVFISNPILSNDAVKFINPLSLNTVEKSAKL